jgi:hypothetical protein
MFAGVIANSVSVTWTAPAGTPLVFESAFVAMTKAKKLNIIASNANITVAVTASSRSLRRNKGMKDLSSGDGCFRYILGWKGDARQCRTQRSPWA